MREVNWARNYEYGAQAVHRPTSVEQVQEIVAGASSVHVLGSRHSFNGIADSEELIRLDDLPADVMVDRSRSTVSFSAGLTYGELAQALNAEGLALHNLASLPHISVAGAVATATHGSGNANGNLATAVAGLEMVTSTGEIVKAARGDPDFEGLVVGLGALGAVTRLTLDVEPAYQVRQRVFEGLEWRALAHHFDEISGAGHSVSVWTSWGPKIEQVWVKSRVGEEAEEIAADFFGAAAASVDRHPVLGLDPVSCTPQLGRPGLWSDRLPHFRMGFRPGSGDELQSEYLVARGYALAAIERVRAMADRIRPVLRIAEIRTVATDRLWMSGEYGRDTVGIHFAWEHDQSAVEDVLGQLEAALAPLGARPHWGKLFLADPAAIAPLYERRRDFVSLQRRLDPRGAFRNLWFTESVLGEQ